MEKLLALALPLLLLALLAGSPGPVGHETDTGEDDPQTEGTGPFDD